MSGREVYAKHATTCGQCGSSITIFELQYGGWMRILRRWLDRQRVRKGVPPGPVPPPPKRPQPPEAKDTRDGKSPPKRAKE